MTDAGLKDLTGLKSLQTLKVRNNKVAHAGLKDLDSPLLSHEPSKAFPIAKAERKLFAERMVRNAGELAQRLVDVFGPHADALGFLELQRRRVDRDGELFLVRGTDHAVSLDAVTEEPGRTDRPVILAVTLEFTSRRRS